MPIKISPASDDALGIAFGKRKAQNILRKKRDDEEFRKTLHRVFYLSNGTKVTINARGGTVHVTAVAALSRAIGKWMAYECGYQYLRWYMLRDVDHIIYMPSRRFESGVYEYAAFSSLEMTAIRALRDLDQPGRLAHIENIRDDIANKFGAEWLLGSVLSGLPYPQSEVLGPYFIQITNEDVTFDGGGTTNIHTLSYTVFDGVDITASGNSSFIETFTPSGGYLTFNNWPSCVTPAFGEFFGDLPISSSEVMDGFLASGSVYYNHNNTSGPLFTQSLTYSRIDDAITAWLREPSTVIDQGLTFYGSTGDKAVQPGSIVHVICLEYQVNERYSDNTYWTPFIDLIDRSYTVEMVPDETYDVLHPMMSLTPEDQAIIDAEAPWRPVNATSVRVLRHFAVKLGHSVGGLADRQWTDATLAAGQTLIAGNTVLGSFDAIDPWGLPEMVVVIENVNQSFSPASNSYSNAVSQTYAEGTPYTGEWAAANTTDEIRSKIMSEVLSRAGFI